MGESRRIPLTELQPSQLYVSSEKLAAVTAASAGLGAEDMAPLPVMTLGGRRVLTDGHTRALAAWRRGLVEVPIAPDEDDLDVRAYEICVAWCREAGIEAIQHLDGRVVDPETYERRWLRRCRAMHRSLDARAPREAEG